MEPVLYRERLLPSISMVFSIVLLCIGAGLIALPFGQLLAMIIGSSMLLAILLLSIALAPTVLLTKKSLRVGKAYIERRYLGSATCIAVAASFMERGTKLDSRAFTLFRPGIKTLVKVMILDENDPTPYWLFASRNAEVLCSLLNQTS